MELNSLLRASDVGAVWVTQENGDELGVATVSNVANIAHMVVKVAGLSSGSGGLIYAPRSCNIPSTKDPSELGTKVLFIGLLDGVDAVESEVTTDFIIDELYTLALSAAGELVFTAQHD
jgi:hypothetical protein